MSVFINGEYSATPYSLYPKKPSNITTYRKAINTIRKNITTASLQDVHLYMFNIHPDQLESAHALFDKEDARRLMRVTWNDEYNFIVKYMPGAAHEQAYAFWSTRLFPIALSRLIPPQADIGCTGTGQINYRLGPRQKQPDAGIMPDINPSGMPSIVMEIGSSESLTQLVIDTAYWLEHSDQIQLVIIISIDRPHPPFPNFPRIRIQLWRCSPSTSPVRPQAGRERVARNIWNADWTNVSTPFYILLSDIFRGPPPAQYGNQDRVFLNTQAWRLAIINNY